MKFIIRPPKLEDAKEINELRRMKGVLEGTLAMPSERTMLTEQWLQNLGSDDHQFVAQIPDGTPEVIGFAGLHAFPGRRRHVGGIGIMIHTDYQGQGVGRALMDGLLDVADNWLMLHRVELEVYCDNQAAVGLYKSLGFQIEGTRRMGSIRQGRCADEYLMARIRE